MSKKIILSENLKQKIIMTAKATYQYTIADAAKEFSLSKHALKNNFTAYELDTIFFHGCKDTTKKKLHDFNIGKKHTEDQKLKISIGVAATSKTKTAEEKAIAAKKAQQTKIQKWGSWEAYNEHQQIETKKTLVKKYGSVSYNNIEQRKQTCLEKYGDENYNNKTKIKETQYKLYGGYAFTDKTKYENTMIKRYSVKHNWSSNDPKLNGRESMFNNAGGKDEHYKKIIAKGKKTRLELYGNEFYSNSEKAQRTMLEKYGVRFYCTTDECRKKLLLDNVKTKRYNTMKKNNSFNISKPEQEVKKLLELKFGKDDVETEYNKDIRYPFKCDFYVKSKDLFIELNLYPTHGLHPFEKDNQDDIALLNKLKNNPTKWNTTMINVWTIRDVAKLNAAKINNLNYLVLYPVDDYITIIKNIS